MKLVRFGAAGQEKPGLVDSQGQIRDLSGLVPDIAGKSLSAETLDRIRQTDPGSLPLAPSGQRLGACVGQVRNFIAIGLNYADHAAETGAAIPAEPIVFNKAPSCIVGANDDVVIPRGSQKTDWEVELAIVIGERASYIGANEALRFRRRLLRLQRRVRARIPARARRHLDQGQGLPDLRPARPLARHQGRDPRSAEPVHVARRERRARAGRLDEDHDLQRRADRLLPLALHDPGARRRDHHRHSARRRHGHEARRASSRPATWCRSASRASASSASASSPSRDIQADTSKSWKGH